MILRRIQLCAILICISATARSSERIPILLDTDIGSYVDDAFALGLALAEPRLEVIGITTTGGQAEDRAWLACRFITQCNRQGIPVAAGQTPQPEFPLDWQIQYRRHPAAIFNRTLKPVTKPAVELMHEQLAAKPDKVTIVAVGPLTNVARLLNEHPETKRSIKRIVLLGGSLKPGKDGKPEPEFNIQSDVAAAKTVFESGVPLDVVLADAAEKCLFNADLQRQLFSQHRPLAFQVQNLFELHGNEKPTLYDPLAVAMACGEAFGTWKDERIAIDDAGVMLVKAGPANCRILTETKSQPFLAWMTELLGKDGEANLPRAPRNRSELIDRGKFPSRIHVFEDYDTDIERRWWMCGKEETHDVAPGGRRACRAVLTQDFDDKRGDVKTMYRAVIFNPVPGPPMGPNTRLSFRYKLTGTDELRVQLYSLTNGYHRYLSLAGLPQNEWQQGTVDMTAMRRPDGTGGPLSRDERIDDIQFYVDPRAELLIDDVILYDAAVEKETRPFPKRILFTAWFDTGKQGQEWPGKFEIVSHEKPRTWKFARSIAAEDGQPTLRVSIRGPRRLAEQLEMTFQYRLRGASAFKVDLAHEGRVLGLSQELTDLPRDEWKDAKITFRLAGKSEEQVADEIRFDLPAGAELSLDDLLLYVPGEDVRR